MGTLGFLTPFESADAAATLERVLAADQAPVFCTLRTRRRCEVVWCGRGVGFQFFRVEGQSPSRPGARVLRMRRAARWSGATHPEP